jgi:hypothetical protein
MMASILIISCQISSQKASTARNKDDHGSFQLTRYDKFHNGLTGQHLCPSRQRHRLVANEKILIFTA